MLIIVKHKILCRLPQVSHLFANTMAQAPDPIPRAESSPRAHRRTNSADSSGRTGILPVIHRQAGRLSHRSVFHFFRPPYSDSRKFCLIALLLNRRAASCRKGQGYGNVASEGATAGQASSGTPGKSNHRIVIEMRWLFANHLGEQPLRSPAVQGFHFVQFFVPSQSFEAHPEVGRDLNPVT